MRGYVYVYVFMYVRMDVLASLYGRIRVCMYVFLSLVHAYVLEFVRSKRSSTVQQVSQPDLSLCCC